MIEQYLNQLQQKFNYSQELINALSKIIPCLIQHYGIEYQNIILGALANCEIHIQKPNENYKDYLNSYFGTNKNWETPLGANAFYSKDIKVENNQVAAKSIIYIFQPILEKFDFSNDNNLAVLIHEICHLVKGFNRITIKDGKIISPTGLMYEEFDFNGNQLNGDWSINVGIEEAITCYDEEQITNMILNHQFESNSYHSISKLVSKLMQHNDIKKAIQKAQFTGTDDWISLLGKETANKLIENFDTLIKIDYLSNKDLGLDDDDEIDRLLEEGLDFDEIYKIMLKKTEEQREKIWAPYHEAYDEVESFIENYTSKEQLESFSHSLKDADQKSIELIQLMSYQLQFGNETLNIERTI